jgi:NAD(P)H-dependent FMN reductase
MDRRPRRQPSATRQSRSRRALARRPAGPRDATVELLDLHVLQLPMYSPELVADALVVVHPLISTCYEADGMLRSSPMYNGSVSGSFKNGIDWSAPLDVRWG